MTERDIKRDREMCELTLEVFKEDAVADEAHDFSATVTGCASLALDYLTLCEHQQRMIEAAERCAYAAERERDLWRTKYEAIRSERDKTLPYPIDDQQQTCKVCGRPMKFDFHVPDTLWKIVVPKEHHDHAICLYCFDEYANQTGVEYAIDDICFAGKAIRLRQTDAEREHDSLKQQLAEANAKIEREVAARNSLSIQLDHMKGLWDERGNEICTLKANLAEANAELDMMTELMRKQNAAFTEMREALGLAWGLIESDCRDLLDNCALNQGETICTADKSYCETACDEVRLLHLVPKALSSDAGKDLLERLRQAEELLAQVKPELLDCLSCEGEICLYYKRCHTQEPYATIDAFLKGGGKDA